MLLLYSTSHLGFPGASVVKNLPANAGRNAQEVQIQSQGGKDLLEKEMATHSSILVWRTPWTEEPGGLQSMGMQRFRHNLATEHISHSATHGYENCTIYILHLTCGGMFRQLALQSDTKFTLHGEIRPHVSKRVLGT